MKRLFLSLLLVLLSSSRVLAVVAFDARSPSGITSGTGNLSHTHTPVGTPRAAICWVVQEGTTDQVTGITYGAATMKEMTGSPNIHATGFGGVVHGFFLGAGIPTGAQTVTATVSGADNKVLYCTTLTASTDTVIVDIDITINTDGVADPSVTLNLTGRASYAEIAFFSGIGAASGITAFANWSQQSNEFDFTDNTAGRYKYDIVGTADVVAGWTQTIDDAVAIAIAVSEARPITRPKILQ